MFSFQWVTVKHQAELLKRSWQHMFVVYTGLTLLLNLYQKLSSDVNRCASHSCHVHECTTLCSQVMTKRQGFRILLL